MRRSLAFAALAALAAAGAARAAPALPGLIDRADALDLADETGWRRLLHVPAGAATSHVDDPAFFLARDGRTDRRAELEATLVALFGRAPDGSDTASGADPDAGPDARCRFVARERWLRERLDLGPAEVPARCADYHRWRATLSAHSATLVFPAAYLNNPSSMFGHTLLRLDPPDVATGSRWLSWSIDFAADTTGSAARGPLYVWKGLTGGYPGRFSLQPYFTHLRDYGAIENRDIWEYPLDLAPAEIDRLVQHLWELRDVAFDYYYFRENCSFRLLELLEIARPSLDLASGFALTAIPADTVKAVAAAGLVDGQRWVPSQATLLRADLEAMPRAERTAVEALAEHPATGGDEDFLSRSDGERARIVGAADRLLTYRARRSPKTPEAAERRLAMLSLLAEHGGGGGGASALADAGGLDRPSSPHVGHETTLASLGVGSDDGRGHVRLAFRASYHDLLDPPAGYVPGAAISLGELELRADEGGEARVESFALIGIRSLAPAVAAVPAISWGADIGLVRDENVEADRLMLRVGGLAGASTAFGARDGGSRHGAPRALGYALAGPSLDALDRRGDEGLDARVNAHARLGLLAYGRFGTTRAELGVDALQGRSLRTGAEIAHDLPVGRGRSLRASGSVRELDGVRREALALALRVRF